MQYFNEHVGSNGNASDMYSEVPRSNQSQDTSNYSEVFLGLPQPLQRNTRPLIEAETLIPPPPLLDCSTKFSRVGVHKKLPELLGL
jgi:hypothetical protein